jgi:hypothetical protein
MGNLSTGAGWISGPSFDLGGRVPGGGGLGVMGVMTTRVVTSAKSWQTTVIVVFLCLPIIYGIEIVVGLSCLCRGGLGLAHT